MTFKVTVVNKLSENVLHKGRNGAGVKAELFFIRSITSSDIRFFIEKLKDVISKKIFEESAALAYCTANFEG